MDYETLNEIYDNDEKDMESYIEYPDEPNDEDDDRLWNTDYIDENPVY